MTTEITYKCDGCGEERDNPNPTKLGGGWVSVKVAAVRGNWSRVRHLCPDCRTEYRSAVEGVFN